MKELSGHLWAGLPTMQPRVSVVRWMSVLFQPTTPTRQNKWSNIRLAHIFLGDLQNSELGNSKNVSFHGDGINILAHPGCLQH